MRSPAASAFAGQRVLFFLFFNNWPERPTESQRPRLRAPTRGSIVRVFKWQRVIGTPYSAVLGPSPEAPVIRRFLLNGVLMGNFGVRVELYPSTMIVIFLLGYTGLTGRLSLTLATAHFSHLLFFFKLNKTFLVTVCFSFVQVTFPAVSNFLGLSCFTVWGLQRKVKSLSVRFLRNAVPVAKNAIHGKRWTKKRKEKRSRTAKSRRAQRWTCC